jgi:endonuclease/exonuclease/phosphatase family metal-dependent hydrolase
MLPNHCSHARPRFNRPRNERPAWAPAARALLALVLLAAPYAAHAQVQPRGGAVAIPSAAPELKVMTWNIRGGKAKIGDDGEPHTQGCKPNFDPDYMNGIATEIKSHAGLDVVALQEVYRAQAGFLMPRLDGRLGQSPRLFFAKTLNCGPGPDDDYGIAIISRHPFVEGSEKSARLCRTSSDEPLGEWPFFTPHCPGKTQEPRVLARVIIKVDGRPVHIYNTHLPPAGAVHVGMAALILLLTGDDPGRAVILGDFYVYPDDAAYKVITHKFRDAWLGASPAEKEACDGKGSTHPTLPNPHVRSDYVFLSKEGFRVDGARVTCTRTLLEEFGLTRSSPNVKLRVPDHLPLSVRLAF